MTPRNTSQPYNLKLRSITWLWLLVSVVTMALPFTAQAQFAEPLLDSQSGTPMPPPLGDGPIPGPEIPGDTVNSILPPPPGPGNMPPASMFASGFGENRTIVRVYRQRSGGPMNSSRGMREDRTIRPDQLSSFQIEKINEILGINMLSGQANMDVQATNEQIEKIDDVLAAYPGFTPGPRKKIEKDQRGNIDPARLQRDASIFTFDGILPSVRYLARYLVILGVVSATVFMAIAATSVVFGHQYGGSRVIGVAGGLILLLMSYTIWKVVQMNTFKAVWKAGMKDSARSQNRPFNNGLTDQLSDTSTPGIPKEPPAGPQRSGVPLLPFGNAGNQ